MATVAPLIATVSLLTSPIVIVSASAFVPNVRVSQAAESHTDIEVAVAAPSVSAPAELASSPLPAAVSTLLASVNTPLDEILLAEEKNCKAPVTPDCKVRVLLPVALICGLVAPSDRLPLVSAGI